MTAGGGGDGGGVDVVAEELAGWVGPAAAVHRQLVTLLKPGEHRRAGPPPRDGGAGTQT